MTKAPRQARVVGCVALALVGLVACSTGSWNVKESDLPPEAALAYPGASAQHRSWNPGEKGEYIDGGSAETVPHLSTDYSMSPTAVMDVIEWYRSHLEELGYTVDPPVRYGEVRLTGVRTTDDFTFTFVVRVVPSADDTAQEYHVGLEVKPT